MLIKSVYDDVNDRIGENENAYLSFSRFNRFSRLGELRLMDWLTGDVAAVQPPEPWLTQKNKDWLSVFLKKFPTQVVNSQITKPSDYYKYDNFYKIGSKASADCEEDEPKDDCNIPIEVIDGQKYYGRCNSYIKEKRPSYNNPICKMIGKVIEIAPSDLGSVVLEYLRFPVFGEIKTVFDPVYKEEVADPIKSINYEWDERSRELLIYFITDSFATYTRERALKESNMATKKTERG